MIKWSQRRKTSRMNKSPEFIGEALGDLFSHWVGFELPGLRQSLGLASLSEAGRLKAEWELIVFAAYVLQKLISRRFDDAQAGPAARGAFMETALDEELLETVKNLMESRLMEYDESPFQEPDGSMGAELCAQLYGHIYMDESEDDARWELLRKAFSALSQKAQPILS